MSDRIFFESPAIMLLTPQLVAQLNASALPFGSAPPPPEQQQEEELQEERDTTPEEDGSSGEKKRKKKKAKANAKRPEEKPPGQPPERKDTPHFAFSAFQLSPEPEKLPLPKLVG